MSAMPISPLRRRMSEDMAVRRRVEKTKSNYIHHIENFTAFLGRSPDTATAEDVRRFQVHLTEIGVEPSSINRRPRRCVSSLAPPLIGLSSACISPARTTKASTARAFDRGGRPTSRSGTRSRLKYKAALSIAYGAGLRFGEIVMLRVSDIDCKRMRSVSSRQRPQGPAHDALTAAARAAQGMVAAMPVEGLAVPGPGSAAADHDTTAEPGLPHGGKAGLGSWVSPHTFEALIRHA